MLNGPNDWLLDGMEGALFNAIHAITAECGDRFTHYSLINGTYFAGIVWC